jgi:hypothetical protein
MFDHWHAKFEAGEPLHQVFVTVSATLKDQVGRRNGCLLAEHAKKLRRATRGLAVLQQFWEPSQPGCLPCAPQVAKAFVRLRNGLPAVTPDRAAAYAAAAARQIPELPGRARGGLAAVPEQQAAFAHAGW